MLISSRNWQCHWHWILFALAIALIVSIYISLLFGAVTISAEHLFIWSRDVFASMVDVGVVYPDLVQASVNISHTQSHIIIQELRLPRALLATGVGALMASCGAVTQGLFRNPLADPSLIGVSAGAAAGASAVIVLLDGLSLKGMLGLSFLPAGIASLGIVSLGAFFGGILAVVFVYRIATGINGTSVSTMLLAGIAITFLAGSVSNIFEFIADNDMLRRISLWRMGGLDAADYSRVSIVAAVTLVIFLVLPRYYAALNALLLGESEARHLGIDVTHTKKMIVLVVAASIGTCVAIAGTISFVGLVVPHMIRMCMGPNHRFLIPLSAFFGALLLLIADVFARTIIAPTELPVGLVTAIIGAPVFISLLRQRHQYAMQ